MGSMGKIREFFAKLMDGRTEKEDGPYKKFWNSPKAGIPLWIVAAGFTVHWLEFPPAPGYAIGALAVVAGIMSVREIKTIGKISWVVLLICLLVTEFRAIDKDRADNAQTQRVFFEAQQKSFGAISRQATDNFRQTTSGLETAINGLNSVLGTTQDVAKLAKTNLENVTGGDSFAYATPGLRWDGKVTLTVNNHGPQILTGVQIVLDESWTRPFGGGDINRLPDSHRYISVGTIPP